LFEHAVSLEPDNPKALLYSGFGAATRGDRATARKRWLALKALHPPAEIDAMLDQRIAELAPPIWGLRARNLASPTWQRACPARHKLPRRRRLIRRRKRP